MISHQCLLGSGCLATNFLCKVPLIRHHWFPGTWLGALHPLVSGNDPRRPSATQEQRQNNGLLDEFARRLMAAVQARLAVRAEPDPRLDRAQRLVRSQPSAGVRATKIQRKVRISRSLHSVH